MLADALRPLPTTWAIVLAAGQSVRFQATALQHGQPLPTPNKTQLPLHGQPVWHWSALALAATPCLQGMVLVLPPEATTNDWPWPANLPPSLVTLTTTGGATRTHSVAQGMACLKAYLAQHPQVSPPQGVLIHDAARPYVQAAWLTELLADWWQQAPPQQPHAPCLGMATGHPAHDSLKQVDAHNRIIASPNRNEHWQVQTPQVAYYTALQAALQAWQALPDADKPLLTDDVQLLAWALAHGALGTTLAPFVADTSQAYCGVWANAAYNPKLTVHHDWVYAPPPTHPHPHTS